MLLSQVFSLDDDLAGEKFEQACVGTDLFAAIAAAKQDDIHIEFVPKLAVWQLFDKFGYDLNISKCLDYLLVIFYYTWHKKNSGGGVGRGAAGGGGGGGAGGRNI